MRIYCQNGKKIGWCLPHFLHTAFADLLFDFPFLDVGMGSVGTGRVGAGSGTVDAGKSISRLSNKKCVDLLAAGPRFYGVA